VIVSIDPVGEPGPHLHRWHMSISCADRLPTWEEIRTARYAFVPDGLTMAMLLPPRNRYVNVHEYTMHLYETRDMPEDGA
jgi:hypothetical protein